MSRSIASWPIPPGALRSVSRRWLRSAIDCSTVSAMAAKCCSSAAISAGSAFWVRWSGRSNALVVRRFTGTSSDLRAETLDRKFRAHERAESLLKLEVAESAAPGRALLLGRSAIRPSCRCGDHQAQRDADNLHYVK